jgi:hypothetical protein
VSVELEFRGRGAEDLDRLGKRLKAMGDGGLRSELLAGIRKAAKPLPQAVRASALEKLPQRGGLAARIAGSRMSTRTRLSGNNVGVRFEAKGVYNLRRMDRGQVRHMAFGNPKSWHTQEIPEGWFSQPIEDIAPDVRDDVNEAMSNVADKITGGP